MKLTRNFQCFVLVIIVLVVIFVGYMKLRRKPLVLYRSNYIPSVNVQRMHIMLSYYHVQYGNSSIMNLSASPYCFDSALTDYSREAVRLRTFDKEDMYEYFEISQGKKLEMQHSAKPMAVLEKMNDTSLLKDSTYVSLGIAATDREDQWYFTFSEMKCKKAIPYTEGIVTWFKELTNSTIEG